MDISVFPDWKKIGWHVGKRIRDILRPIPIESDESKKARKIRRLHDNFKGFVYFDDFETLHAWSADDIDPVQQANTPLLERQVAANGGELEKSTSVLLCHDYRGGYHDYESVRPAHLEFEMYSCEYLQYVDTFIYFSHKLVCVPPSSWINTMHRNGVKILGTFLFEPQTPDIERVLEQVNGEFIVAKQLSCLAVNIGFDGWLLNFEKEFPKSCPNFATTLIEFISELRRLMGSQRSVIWYDALNIDNEVEYQNSLTSKNLDFARSANALFTNYKWTGKNIREASILAAEHDIRSSTVFFGIDVWAQNTNMPGPPRITFPPKGGGGTNTGIVRFPLWRRFPGSPRRLV